MPYKALAGCAGSVQGLLFAACLAILSTTALASDTVTVTCFNCGEIQYQNTASSAIQSGHATVYVADLHRRELRKYTVIKEQEPGYTLTHVQLQDLDSEDQSEWSQMLHVLHLVDQQKALDASNSPNGANGIDSAVTLGANWSLRGSADNWVISQLSWVGGFNALAGTRFNPLRLVGDLSSLAGRVEVKFPDGSSAMFDVSLWYEVDTNQVRVDARVDPSSLRDAAGNYIPYDRATFNEGFSTWISTDDSLREFLRAAERYGIPILPFGPGLPTRCRDTPRGVECTPIRE
jgi:hypothetical protein